MFILIFFFFFLQFVSHFFINGNCPFIQVVNWLEGPGSEQMRTQWGIGDSIRASQALQQKHEEIESQHSVGGHCYYMTYSICCLCTV